MAAQPRLALACRCSPFRRSSKSRSSASLPSRRGPGTAATHFPGLLLRQALAREHDHTDSLCALAGVNKELSALAAPHLFDTLSSLSSITSVSRYSILRCHSKLVTHVRLNQASTTSFAAHEYTMPILHLLPNLRRLSLHSHSAGVLFGDTGGDLDRAGDPGVESSSVEAMEQTELVDERRRAFRAITPRITSLTLDEWDPDDAARFLRQFPNLEKLTLLKVGDYVVDPLAAPLLDDILFGGWNP